MSIASEITRLQNAKAALKESIEAKGVTVGDSAKLDEYHVLVDNIPQGSSKILSLDDDVVFVDWDGSLLYTYTKEEFLALNNLPAVPEHDELKDGEWNWSLNGAKERVRIYDRLLIGATYNIVEQGIIYYVTIKNSPSNVNQLSLSYGGSGGSVLVDWGDGLTSVGVNTGNNNYLRHHYNEKGKYKVVVTTSAETVGTRNVCIDTIYAGYGYLNKAIFNDDFLIPYRSNDNYGNDAICFAGKNCCYSSNFNFSNSNCFKKILISKECSGDYIVDPWAKSSVARLINIVFPNNIFTNLDIAYYNIVCLPENTKGNGYIKISCIYGNIPLCISEGITRFNTYVSEVKSIVQIQFPSTFTSLTYTIGANRLYKLLFPYGFLSTTVAIPDAEIIVFPITTTAINSFDSITGSIYIYSIVPPTLGTVPTLFGQIYVPAESVENYKAATNWSNYANKIFPIPTE